MINTNCNTIFQLYHRGQFYWWRIQGLCCLTFCLLVFCFYYLCFYCCCFCYPNHPSTIKISSMLWPLKPISGVMISVLALFKPRLSQNKNYKFGIRCFSATSTELRRKSKDWLAQIRKMCQRDMVYMRTVASVDYHYKIPIKHVGLVQIRYHHYLMEINLCSPWYNSNKLLTSC